MTRRETLECIVESVGTDAITHLLLSLSWRSDSGEG